MVSPPWDVRFVFSDEQRILTSVGSLSYVIHHTASLAFGVVSEIPLSRVSSKNKSKHWQHFPANVAVRITSGGKVTFLSTQARAIRVLHLYNYSIVVKPQQVSTFPDISRKVAIIRAHTVSKINLHL
jgi:hypothetical protein